MAKHAKDVSLCRKQAGTGFGRVCAQCEGKCVACDSYANPLKLARVCEECNFSYLTGCCILCNVRRGVGQELFPAYYCRQCVALEKDRDGCPRTLTRIASKRARTDIKVGTSALAQS